MMSNRSLAALNGFLIMGTEKLFLYHLAVFSMCLFLFSIINIQIIPQVSAQQTNSAIMSTATTLSGHISRFSFYEYPAWKVSGEWNMSLAKPLAQSQPNPTVKTFYSSMLHSCCALSGRTTHRDTISNFKQTSASMNGTTSGIINGTASITMGTSSLQNIPISINLTGNELTLWVDPTKTDAHFGDLDEIPIDGTIDKGQ